MGLWHKQGESVDDTSTRGRSDNSASLVLNFTEYTSIDSKRMAQLCSVNDVSNLYFYAPLFLN